MCTDEWPGQCTTGTHQSPINLYSYDSEIRFGSPLLFNNYRYDYSGIVQNNGHACKSYNASKYAVSIV